MEEYLKAFMDNFIPITTLCVVIATFISARATHKSTDVVKEGLLDQLRPQPNLRIHFISPSDPNEKSRCAISIESQNGKAPGRIVGLGVYVRCLSPRVHGVAVDFSDLIDLDFSPSHKINGTQKIDADWMHGCTNISALVTLTYKDSMGFRTYKSRTFVEGNRIVGGTVDVIERGKIQSWIDSFHAFRSRRSKR